MNTLEARGAGRLLAALLLAACAWGADGAARAGTPCAGPARLCASVDANTRAPARAADVGALSRVAGETLNSAVTRTVANAALHANVADETLNSPFADAGDAPVMHANVAGETLDSTFAEADDAPAMHADSGGNTAHVAFARTAGVPLDAAFVVDAGDPAIQPKPARPPGADPASTTTAAGRPGAASTSESATGSAAPDAAAASATGASAQPDNQPAIQPVAPIRIALLLPTRSATLATAADAVRAGFMAGMERDGSGFTADVVATGDAPRDVLDAYARAAAVSDVIVGPLARSAVAALVGSAAVSKPTVVLSVPEGRPALPRGVLVAGLSIEDEARQIAEWAAREHPQGRALVLTGGAAWAQRAATAFEARWTELGHTNQRFPLPSGDAGKAALDELKQKLEIDPPDLLFAALDGAQLRLVRATAGAATLPCYGGGAAHPGRTLDPGATPLDGVRLLDLPWLVRPDQPAVMVYPRPLNTDQPLDMDRLYALGIDAFRVARELALHGDAPFGLDGVTGRLDVSAGPGGQLTLQRREAAVVVRNGVFEPVDKDR